MNKFNLMSLPLIAAAGFLTASAANAESRLTRECRTALELGPAFIRPEMQSRCVGALAAAGLTREASMMARVNPTGSGTRGNAGAGSGGTGATAGGTSVNASVGTGGSGLSVGANVGGVTGSGGGGLDVRVDSGSSNVATVGTGGSSAGRDSAVDVQVGGEARDSIADVGVAEPDSLAEVSVGGDKGLSVSIGKR